MGASGHVTVDFGAFPGAAEASYTVTSADLSIAGLLATSEVEAWIEPADTTDHSADEHRVETLAAFADKQSIVPGTSYVIKLVNTSQLFDMSGPEPKGTLIYGKWNVGTAWN